MLSLITSAPTFVVRDALGLVPGAVVEPAYGTAPRWAETLITAPQSDALALGLARISAFRFETWRPRPAIADPTFAMAAANVDRTREGGSSAPAARW